MAVKAETLEEKLKTSIIRDLLSGWKNPDTKAVQDLFDARQEAKALGEGNPVPVVINGKRYHVTSNGYGSQVKKR